MPRRLSTATAGREKEPSDDNAHGQAKDKEATSACFWCVKCKYSCAMDHCKIRPPPTKETDSEEDSACPADSTRPADAIVAEAEAPQQNDPLVALFVALKKVTENLLPETQTEVLKKVIVILQEAMLKDLQIRTGAELMHWMTNVVLERQ